MTQRENVVAVTEDDSAGPPPAADRAGTDEFELTQQFVAQMLAVRRPSVTVAAGILQKAGLIRYTRGNLTVVDRRRLEASSCECYEVVKKEFERLLRT